jgi:hypothetical protein
MKEGILQKWIEVTGHFDHDTDGEFVFDCEMPEDGQEILVTLTGGYISRNIGYIDKNGYHLVSGWEWEDVFKWAPMPPAWWEETE